jgi:DNA-binding CsgD family transcriptional regulator
VNNELAQGNGVFDDKDIGFISNYIANSLEGKVGVASLLNSLNQRIPICSVNYWVLKRDALTRDYACLAYSYQKTSENTFILNVSNEQYRSSTKLGVNCVICLKTMQRLMQSESSCYEIHEHSEGLQVVKVNLPDPLTGSRVIYSFQFSIVDQKLESSDMLILKCLLPILFHAARQLGNSVSSQGLLSKREVAILEWIKQGKSTWDISQVLSITERTVNFHVRNVYKKLEVVSRAQAVAVGIDLGVIESFVSRNETVCID